MRGGRRPLACEQHYLAGCCRSPCCKQRTELVDGERNGENTEERGGLGVVLLRSTDRPGCSSLTFHDARGQPAGVRAQDPRVQDVLRAARRSAVPPQPTPRTPAHAAR